VALEAPSGNRLSRLQLRLAPLSGGRISVERLGRATVRVRGDRVEQAVLSPGDTLEIADHALFLCVQRPERLPPAVDAATLARFDAPFGGPDPFGLVGESPALWALRDRLAFVAPRPGHVLVLGPSGVGKELVARAIHDASGRRDAPFVCMNCAALTETLLESELFGHEKGAFTGATERKAGKFEAAHKGTLFLDEIGEMSPAIQAKFLRVLEGHPFERVGGSARVQVDVRVVAATNRDLEDAVTAGEFRRDLYFRLKVVEILVPPLRKRPEDVETLATHFFQRFAPEAGRRLLGFTPEALAAMRAYHWPGNIRELRNCIERAVVLSQDEWINANDLALSQLASPGDTGVAPAGRPAPFTPTSLDEMERKHVLATLEAVGGNKTKAATILGIERSTLDRKLARWAAKPPKPEA
jgi:Nif-specific regulatory protein